MSGKSLSPPDGFVNLNNPGEKWGQDRRLKAPTIRDHDTTFPGTQTVNLTTPLNVLLSFAQFEREVIGERIGDKIQLRPRHLAKSRPAMPESPGEEVRSLFGIL
jgi:hypothetical protein